MLDVIGENVFGFCIVGAIGIYVVEKGRGIVICVVEEEYNADRTAGRDEGVNVVEVSWHGGV
jgi:hypothetical protein